MAPAPAPLTDAQRLAQLRQGDASAFRYFYEQHWYNLYRTAYAKTGRQAVAEELAQEVFVRLWTNRQTLLIDNVAAWLHTCVRHLIIDYIRKNAHERAYLTYLQTYLPIDAGGQPAAAEFDDLAQALGRALDQLPAKTGVVFRLSRFEQRPVADIARQLHLSEKAVEYHLTKALRFLRKHLRHYASLSTLLWLLR